LGYSAAIEKAWEDLARTGVRDNTGVRFLADEYTIDLSRHKVFSVSKNTAASDFTAILILHYLKQRQEGLAALEGEWVDFRELAGGDGYYPAFRKRVIEVLIAKYGKCPDKILSVFEHFDGQRLDKGDVSIRIEAFAGIPVLVIFWRGDEEFGPEANLLFDRSICHILCLEDIAVMAGIVAHRL